MTIQVDKSGESGIRSLRELFLYENRCQFVHEKCHTYGWNDIYSFAMDGSPVGYGCIWGLHNREDRDTIFEFYLLPGNERHAGKFFSALCRASGASQVEAQTNHPQLSALLFQYTRSIQAECILFADAYRTAWPPGDIVLRPPLVTTNTHPDCREYVLLEGDREIGRGGLMLNYNRPYADLYYEIHELYRAQGFGTLMVQELKKAAYALDRVPAARCNIDNEVSRAVLLKGGFTVCGNILLGDICRERLIA